MGYQPSLNLALIKRNPMEGAELHLLRAQDPLRAVGQRREAFGFVVYAYQDMVFAAAFAVLADVHAAQDCTVEAFVAAWRNIGSLRDPAAFPAWIRRVARSKALRTLRANATETVPETAIHLAGDPPDLVGFLDLKCALFRLKERERRAVILFYVAGLSREEIACATGASVSSVKKCLARARTQLRQEIFEMANEELNHSLPSRSDAVRGRTLLLAGQFAELLASRRPILPALDDCIAQAGDGVVAEAFRDMRGQVVKGEPMADAMRRFPQLFDPTDAAAVLVGEEMGRLDDVLARLAAGERFASADVLRRQYEA